MSAHTLPGAKPESEPVATAGSAAATAEKFPRPHADPQDDWPLDVHLPDEKEDDEC